MLPGAAIFLEIRMKTLSLLLLLALASCGYTPGQRALTGGAIGVGSGAILGGALFGNPAMGALVGGGAGALGGALTAPEPHYGYRR